MFAKKLFIGVALFALLHVYASAAEPVYKVGISPTGKPFTFASVETGKPSGMMVDLIKEIAKAQDFKVDIKVMPWETLIPSLKQGRIDIMVAATTITPKREKVVDFTVPLFPYNETVVVPKEDDHAYTSAADFAGKAVGAMGGTTYYAYLQEVGGFAQIKTYDSVADVMRDVALGRIAAGFVDEPIVRYIFNTQGDRWSEVKIPSTYEPAVVSQIGMAVQEGNDEILEKLNSEIKKLKADGVIVELLKKWGVR